MRVDKQNDPGASYDALQWALDFMRQYEKKLLQRAIKIAKTQRKDRQLGIIRQTYIQEP